jgi:hypothetical protein
MIKTTEYILNIDDILYLLEAHIIQESGRTMSLKDIKKSNIIEVKNIKDNDFHSQGIEAEDLRVIIKKEQIISEPEYIKKAIQSIHLTD